MTKGKGEKKELQALVQHAQCCLAGLQFSCKTLLLRVGQVEVRAPDLDGLVSPMPKEIVEILNGIINAQATHAEMEQIIEKMA